VLPQSYLAKKYCWGGKSLQTADQIHIQVEQFMETQPRLRVYSGLRRLSAGDHRCGLAVDIVPLDRNDKASIDRAYAAALKLQRAGKVAYVEPLSATWIPGNHHLHISFRRCPAPQLARLTPPLRRLLRR